MKYPVKEEDEKKEKSLLEGTLSHPRNVDLPDRRIESNHDEKTPRCGGDQSSENIATEEEVTWRNLPHKKQLLLLALCRLSTPLSNACLLPYLYHLAESILSDSTHSSAQQEISRLTGLLVAAYPLGQMTTSLVWGRLSDRYGRKPAILLGIAISVISNMCFGFSKTIGMLLFWRVLAGMANGILGVMRTMTAEMVQGNRHRTRAFLAMPVVFNSGRVVALAIGGFLADPVGNIPSLFGQKGLFNVNRNEEGVKWAVEYPYALPAVFNGTMLAVCLLLAAIGLKETLPSEERSGLTASESIREFIQRWSTCNPRFAYTAIKVEEGEAIFPADGSMNSSTSQSFASPQTTKNCPSHSIWTKPLLKTIIAFGLLPLHNATFLHIFPVFLSMPTSNNPHRTLLRFVGGLGHSPPTVGVFLATVGISGIILQLSIYPRLQARIGTLGAFRLANAIFPIAYILAPFLSLLSDYKKVQWPVMIVVLFAQVLARTIAIPSSVLLLTEASPRRNVLGTVHGAGSTLSSLTSAIGPIVGGLILARGIEIGVIGLVWWCWLLAVALVACAWNFLLSNESDDSAALEQTE